MHKLPLVQRYGWTTGSMQTCNAPVDIHQLMMVTRLDMIRANYYDEITQERDCTDDGLALLLL